MKWAALVPIKWADRKMRLAPGLTPAERVELKNQMLHHVLSVLSRYEMIERTLLLSSGQEFRSIPSICDLGRGLNSELMSARDLLGRIPLLVIHADLPLLTPADVTDLLDQAVPGGARTRSQRNRNQCRGDLGPPSFLFYFGMNSFRRHVESRDGPSPVVVTRQGLTHDVDILADLKLALRCGGLPRWNAARCAA